ncbi:MAG: hypothetical protein ACXVW2_17810, partial [Nocardioidaceae bacterium]
PDLLPTAENLDDPLGFREGAEAEPQAYTDAEFDAALAELLDTEAGSSDDDPGPDDPDDKAT